MNFWPFQNARLKCINKYAIFMVLVSVQEDNNLHLEID